MGGIQDVRRMGGFKKAMPFTYIVFTIGALTLAGFPLLSGFWSKDEIISYTLHRGGYFTVIAAGMYIGAILTAFYSMRAVFLVFHGDPAPEAKELEEGHLAHGDPINPATGELEDTDVGFPGPDHQIAEREGEMRVAMGTLAFLAVVAGFVQIPGVTHVIEHWLEPVFEDSRYADSIPSVSAQWIGLGVGAIIAITGISIAYWAYMKNRGVTERWATRFPGVNAWLMNAWYFDWLYDRVFVRPVAAFAVFCNKVIERYVVDGIVTGTTTLVKDGASRVRHLQSGLARAYALSLIGGTAVIVLYFVVVGK
jgi:NADH-quinone oxidoreductase subunit L